MFVLREFYSRWLCVRLFICIHLSGTTMPLYSSADSSIGVARYRKLNGNTIGSSWRCLKSHTTTVMHLPMTQLMILVGWQAATKSGFITVGFPPLVVHICRCSIYYSHRGLRIVGVLVHKAGSVHFASTHSTFQAPWSCCIPFVSLSALT